MGFALVGGAGAEKIERGLLAAFGVWGVIWALAVFLWMALERWV
jgi:hypothetical protein